MTGLEILSNFETFIDDTLDQSVELSLANQARGELETQLKLMVSTKLDTTKTSVVGGNYLMAYPLPTGILVPKSTIIYVGTTQYTGIPLEHRERYKNDSQHWYADLNAGNYYLTGTVQLAETITFPYITSGTDIAADANTVLKWPTFTHLLIPYQMAKIWFAIDQGDKERSWDDRWTAHFEQLKSALLAWDGQWKLSAINASTPYGSDAPLQTENRINTDI